MNKKIRDKNMPLGTLKRIADFLPSPAELAVHEDTVKITLALKRSSIQFFKNEARRHHTKYQKMIRDLVDRYATRYQTV